MAGLAALVEQAVETFGDLHILVNNAGILRDRMLVSMAEEDFDAVIAVHLKGTFNLSRHAAAYWRRRTRSGENVDRAIVNTSSTSGLTGQIGQTNYAAAKAGIAAMTLVNAAELARYGVRSNCIVPVARTRLTEQTPGLSGNMSDALFDPANVSPLVACLAAPDCTFNGQVFSVYGGSVGIFGGWSIAEETATERTWTVGELRTALDELPRSVKVTTQADSMLKSLQSTTLGA